MANKIRAAMQTALGGNAVTGGREPVKLDEVIRVFPEGISINGMGQLTYHDVPYYVYSFVEDPDKYFSGGGDLVKLGDALMDAYGGDLDEINKDLEESPERMKIYKIKTKTGRTYTKVRPLWGSEK